ncbi:MAG: hypothetical protein QOH25_1919 [Acidobacteriota bacterium]|jgi:hypothetical protein|nr:hypothetical protein [Acidobacteriota bacterium]
MKHILLLAVILMFVFGSSAVPTETRAVGDSIVNVNAAEVEGVTIEHQQLAILKPGYAFRRESRSSVAVMKTVRDASFQTGTLTCTSPRRRRGVCTVEFNGDRAKCSSSCYFVGVRGAPRAQ